MFYQLINRLTKQGARISPCLAPSGQKKNEKIPMFLKLQASLMLINSADKHRIHWWKGLLKMPGFACTACIYSIH